MADSNSWKIDEVEEQAGKQRILSHEDVNGFNAQRDGHGSLWFVVFAILTPIVLVIILALLIRLFMRSVRPSAESSLPTGSEDCFSS